MYEAENFNFFVGCMMILYIPKLEFYISSLNMLYNKYLNLLVNKI